MHFGTSWYPEQWPSTRWAADLRLMRAAGMTVIRLGDFSWSRMEPHEGVYQLDWLAAAVDLAAEHGFQLVMCTPTAGPPVWITERYPETLAIASDGRRSTHGNRAHTSPSSPRFRQLSARIAQALALRFGQHPAVIGWQIDNELNTISYDEGTRAQFQDWLRDRYGTIEALNERWTLVFWSQEYQDFSQIPIPVGVHHPSLILAWHRFQTDVFRSFLRVQADVIRQHARPGQWISHNVMTGRDEFDQQAFAAEVDLVGFDYYCGHLNYPDAGGFHDLVRGLKRSNFWMVEVQPGCACWGGVNNVLDRGEARRLAWMTVGHGADAVLYWQWRGSPGGQEQYHGTLVGPDGNPRPFYTEAAQVGREFAAAAPALDGTAPIASVALLLSYDDRWAIEAQPHHQDFQLIPYWMDFYRPLRRRGLDIDVISPYVDLGQYQVAVAPALHLLDDARAEHLLSWVDGGGHLLVGARTGMKDLESILLPSRQPGPLTAGVTVAEYYALDRPVSVEGTLLGAGQTAFASVWAEWLEVADDAQEVEVLLRYGKSSGWLDGQPAVVRVGYGAGSIVYCGAWLDEVALTALLDHVLQRAAVAVLDLPPDLEVCRRRGTGDETVVIVLNHGAEARALSLPGVHTDLITGAEVGEKFEIAPGDVRVLGRKADGS